VLNRKNFSAQPQAEVPFRRGLFKFIVLQYLKDRPCHGYEIIQALGRRFHGLYVPSPGTVYPRLQRLAQSGLVIFAEEEGRKVYSITGDGLRFLSDHADLEKEVNERLSDWENPDNFEDIRSTMREFARLGETLTWEVRKMDCEKLRKVRDELVRAREQLEEIIEDRPAAPRGGRTAGR
jgi:DNA-binding PadR family transcriptional regulator